MMMRSSSPADFGKFIAQDTDKWGKVVKFANINRSDPRTSRPEKFKGFVPLCRRQPTSKAE
jgi:hypothetical protein